MYGSIPKKAFKRHVKKVKNEFNGANLGLEKISDCLGNVKPEKFISEKKINLLFEQIHALDVLLESPSTYMTFHDHYLLEHFSNSQEILSSLTHIKKNFSKSEKEDFIKKFNENWKVKDGKQKNN